MTTDATNLLEKILAWCGSGGEACRTLLEAIPACVVWLGPDDNVQFVSPECQPLLHGQEVTGFLKEIGVAFGAEEPAAQKPSSAIHQATFRMRLDNGEVHWFAHACRPLYDEHGRFQGRISVNIDITEEQRRDALALHSQKQLRALHRVAARLSRATTVEAVYAPAVEGALEVLEASRTALVCFDEDGQPQVVAAQGVAKAKYATLARALPWQPDDLSPQPLWLVDLKTHPEGQAWAKRVPKGVRALALLPLLGSNQLLGALWVYYDAPHEFTESERDLAQILTLNLSAVLSHLRTEEALRESEARIKSVINATPDVIILKNAEGRWLEANQAALALFSLPPTFDYRGKRDEELAAAAPMRHKVFHQCSETDREAWESGGVVHREEIICQPNGEELIFDVLKSPIFYPDGSPKGLVVVGRNITQRKQAERALKESEARYRDLFDNTADVVGLHDLQGRVLDYNPATLRLLGLTSPPQQPFHLKDALAPSVRHLLPEYLARLRQEGHAEGKALIQRPDGEKRLWEYRSTLRTQGVEKPVVRFFARDITERERALRALKESEARFRALAESTVAAIYVASLHDARFVYANPGAQWLTGYTPEELRTMKVWDVVHPDYWEVVRERVRARLRGEPLPPRYELKIVCKDGQERWILLGTADIQWEGRPAVVGSAVDITQHKRHEQALEAELRIARALGQVPETGLESLLIQILEAAQRVVPSAERVSLLLGDNEGNFCVRAVRGRESTEINTFCTTWDAQALLESHQRAPFMIDRPLTRLGFPLSEDGEDPTTKAIVVPLVVREEVLGALLLEGSAQIAPFAVQDLRLLEHFATMASLAIQDARLIANLQQRLHELEVVHDFTLALQQTAGVQGVLKTLIEGVSKVVEGAQSAIFLYYPEDEVLRLAVAKEGSGGLSWSDKIELRPGRGVGGMVFVNGTPYFSEDFSRDPNVLPGARQRMPKGWGGGCFPLRNADEVIGVMFVIAPAEHRMTEPQRYLLESLTEIGGITLHRIRLYEETQQRLRQLQTLQVVAQALTSSLDAHLTLNILVEQARAQFHVDAAAVLLLDQHSPNLSFIAGSGFRETTYKHRRVLVGEPLAGEVAKLQRPVVVTDLRQATLPLPCESFVRREGFRSYVGVPLIAQGRLKGVMELFHRSPFVLDANGMEFLEALAQYAAIALDNAQMFSQLQQYTYELSVAYEATIEGWARALELRDRETEGHTQRVAELTVALARALGVSEQEIPHFRRGALLHDIGKLGVPDEILHKNGALSDEEWAIMRQHPMMAYEMLQDIEYLQPALAIPLFHHERWNGSGYPYGLKGVAIPWPARIFAVVDVYDALTSERSYRKPWPREKALAYLRENSGVLFDPKVVEAFLHLMTA